VQQTSETPTWTRWNDYGIGLLLKGKAELRQAADAFAEVEKLERYDGPLNLARVLYREGRLDEAVEAVHRAADHVDPAAPPWTVAWLSGLINREQGRLDEAEQNFRSVLQSPNEAMRKRGFDFRQDYEVINLLGQTLFDQARRLRGKQNQESRDALLRQAIDQFERTLQLDPENATAHFGLQQIHGQLGDQQARQRHQDLHLKYKPDDNARDRAVALARQKYPAANKAAEAVVIYDLGASR
jgi:tetratricopeptide (TPR) repeat protein